MKRSKKSSKSKAAVSDFKFAGKKDISFDESDGICTMKIKVLGTPRPMYRAHGVSTRTKTVQVFTPSAANKDRFQNCVKGVLAEFNKTDFFDLKGKHPVMIKAIFYFKRPKEHYHLNSNRQLVLSASAPKYVVKVPDVDNVSKLVMDSLNGVVYGDDSVVVEMQATKLWLYDKAGSLYNENAQAEECTILCIRQLRNNVI